MADEHTPALPQLLAHVLSEAVAPGVEILADSDDVAVDSAAGRAAQQSERIGLAAKLDWQLVKADQIGAAGQAFQRVDQLTPQQTRGRRIARRGGPTQRRIVVGEVEIGEFDQTDAVPCAAHQRQQHGLLGRRGLRHDRDQRLDIVASGEGLIPCTEPAAILERGRCAAGAPALHSNRPRTRRKNPPRERRRSRPDASPRSPEPSLPRR